MPNNYSKIAWFKGWNKALSHLSDFVGSASGDSWGKISQSIQELENNMNAWEGNLSPDDPLGGYVAESRISGTFNINAAIKNSSFHTHVGISERHDLASPDIISNWNEDFGLKFMKNAQSSANAQATSFFQRYCEYAKDNPNVSVSDYLEIKGLPDDTPIFDSIYSGQTRIIPADQLKAAKEYLKWKIAKEAENRPDQVGRYQDVLENLQSVIKAPDGTQSVELTKEQSRELARLARERKYRAYADQFCSDDILKWNDYINRGLKAGATAAVITFSIKMLPVIKKMISELIEQGEIDCDTLKASGLDAIPATTESFLRGGVAAVLTLGYETGKFGDIFKLIKPEQVPSIIGALTVVTFSIIKDAYSLATHKITPQEFMLNTQQTFFITACAVGTGIWVQTLFPLMPFAYFLGNIVGTVVGSLTFKVIDNIFVALCVENGYTFFGLVKQDYTLPEEVLKELNIDWQQVDSLSIDTTRIDECEIDCINIDECDADYIKMMSRGVFKIHHIGYLYR